MYSKSDLRWGDQPKHNPPFLDYPNQHIAIERV